MNRTPRTHRQMVQRFLDGESVNDVVVATGASRRDVEATIRAELQRCVVGQVCGRCTNPAMPGCKHCSACSAAAAKRGAESKRRRGL